MGEGALEAARASGLPADLLDRLSEAIVLLDAHDHIRFANQRAVELFGASASGAPLAGQPLREALPHAWEAQLRETVAAVRDTGRATHCEAFHADSGRWLECHAHPLEGERVLLLVRDVSRRRQSLSDADERLRQSEERFRTLVELSSEVIALLDAKWRLRYGSPAYERLIGFAFEAARTLDHRTLIHPDDLHLFEEAERAVMGHPGRPVEVTCRIRRGDGAWRVFTAICRNLLDDPTMRGFLINARDVTEQRHLEEQLRHSQKMEALGQLAGGVAHDFNNILAAITGFAELLRADIEPEDPRQEFASEILRAGARAARVTRQLLAFSRRQALSIEVLDLREVVAELGRMLRPLLHASIALELPKGEGPLYVRADRVQLEQVLMNLTVNARDAMPDGGTLTIEVRRVEGPAGTSAVLEVSDTGTGMTEHTQQHLFEPFFTTKPPGRGTGLGLPTVYGIVRQLGGTIQVHSRLGAGSTFTIALDATDAAPPSVDHHRDGALHHSARRLVLVVEDEEQVRRLVVRMLERANFETRVARNGAEALEILGAGMNPAVVLSDSAMPVMGGRELAKRLAAQRPGLPVVLMSGLLEAGGDGDDERAEWVQHAAGFVEKPFSSDRLLEVIRKALGE